MAEWEENSEELESLGCSVVAVSSDSLEHAEKMQGDSGAKFPIAYEVKREEVEALGAWWAEERGGFVQPPSSCSDEASCLARSTPQDP